MSEQKSIHELKTELDLLYSVVQVVSSLDLDRVLQEIITVTHTITHADSCLIYVLDTATNSLILRASKNPHPDLLQKVRMKFGEGITGWVAQERRAVALSRDAHKDARFKYFRSLPEDRFEAFLSVPIINKQGVVGVINAQHQQPHEHTATEINLLTAVGKLVGSAIEHALLIEETLELKEALELRKVIEKAKGILMDRRGMSEKEAFRMIQKESMNTRTSVKDVCTAIILAEKLLPVDKPR